MTLPESSARSRSSPTSASGLSGVVVLERKRLGIATVLARKGRTADLSSRIREHFGIELPSGPRRVSAGEVAFAGTGPGAWLATHEDAGNAFSSGLAQRLEGLASISDQSDAYVVLRLSGPKVRDTLRKLVPIDLHARALECGDCASTLAGHMAVTFWRLADQGAQSSVFEIAVYRSFAVSLRQAVQEAGSQFGLSERW